MAVIKRNGEEVPFDKQKIVTAIRKAQRQVGDADLSLAVSVANKIDGDGKTVEEIQDAIVAELIHEDRAKLAEAYITYRYQRRIARESNFMDAVATGLFAKEVDNQNANVDGYSFGGRTGEATRTLTKRYALEHCVSKMARENHEGNMIYIHDLDNYAVGMHNCLSVPFDDLLANGFKTRQVDIRPANSVNTAFQLVAVIFQIQSLQQFGGVSATHLDWTMVPYVRKSFARHFVTGMKYIEGKVITISPEKAKENSIDLADYKLYMNVYNYAIDMLDREIHQAVEGLYHNLNSLQSRSGNQLPFSSINYGTCTLPEGRMVIKSLLEASIDGVGRLHKTSIFPCGIFQYMKGVNTKAGEPNYDMYQLALKSTAKRLYPNYANVDWSGNAGYDRNDPTTYFSTINNTVA